MDAHLQPARTAALFFNLKEIIMFKTEYNFPERGKVVITSYPELKSYLIEQLEKLGEVECSVGSLGEPNYLVKLILPKPPRVYDWRKESPDCLHINSDAGGCFNRVIHVNCYDLPKADKRGCKFSFDLSLDSRNYPEEEHNEDKVKEGIDDFVQQAKNGFCYNFKN